jgi:CHASE3 domain sensor protein
LPQACCSSAAIQKRIEALAAANTRDGKTLQALLAGTGPADEMAKFASTRAAFVADWKKAIALSRQETIDEVEERDGSRTLDEGKVQPGADAVAAAAAALKTSIAKDSQAEIKAAHDSASSGTRLIVIVGLLALAAAAAAVWVTRSVTRPVAALGSRLRSLNEYCLAGLTNGLESGAQAT